MNEPIESSLIFDPEPYFLPLVGGEKTHKMTLMLGDCLDRMKEIPDGSIDMILCDLPYGTTGCKWDSVIPFACLWSEYRRLIRKCGAIVLTASQPFTSALVMSNAEWFRYSWIWVKNAAGGFAQAKNKPMPKHEDILVFSMGKTGHADQCKVRAPYFPQGLTSYGKEVRNTQSHRASAFEKRKNARASYIQEFTGYPDSILKFDVQRDGIHPTQKPVALMEYLIRTYSSEGDTVLDNCMGSGTTGVACVNESRSFIGIERDVSYFRAAEIRILEASRRFSEN